MSPMDGSGEAVGGFAVVDVETTGFSPSTDRIVEVAVVSLTPTGEEEGTFSSLIDPGCDPGPTHVHGISAGMLVGAPAFVEVLPYLAGRLTGRVVVGHNVDRFDLAFLSGECARVGGPCVVPDGLATIDTLELAQRHLGLRGKARLVDCCDHFGICWADHHRALGDAQVTAVLFRAMRVRLGDRLLGTAELLDAARSVHWEGTATVAPPVHGRIEPVAT